MPSFKNIFKVVGQEQANSDPSAPPVQGGDVNERISSAINENRILIFMKGNPEFPQCGFSAATVEVFNRLGKPYATRDVLQDPEIRQGIKAFSNWPTIPQVFIDGKFIGGSDIITEMDQNGELEPLVKG